MMNCNKYLYHVTTSDKLESILRNGLIPKIDENGKAVGEYKSAIYLCDCENVGKWKAVLGCDTVLRISNIDFDSLIDRNYGFLHEYINYNKIEPKNIEKVAMYTTKQQVEGLCSNYTLHLCYLVCIIVRYYDGYYDDDKAFIEEWIKHTIRVTIDVMRRLNFGSVRHEVIADALINYGVEGEYTFLDTYNNTKYRLYEQIIRFPKDDLYDLRKELYDFIVETYKDHLHIYTGGYTDGLS